MTNAPPPTSTRRPLRPPVILPVLGVIVLLVALLTPDATTDARGDPRLSTTSTQPLGARLVFDLAERHGWRAERRVDDELPTADAGVVHAVLDPPDAPSARETHVLLEHVRRGGGLLYVLSEWGPLNDSLHVKRGDAGILNTEDPYRAGPIVRRRVRGGCDEGTAGAVTIWADGQVHLQRLSWTAPDSYAVFATARTGFTSDTLKSGAVAAGFAYGRGRIVLVADPDLLRNDVLRVCWWGADVAAARMLEYLGGTGDGPTRSRIVFDEYHQGMGVHPGTMRAIVLYFRRTASGHVLAQVLAAGLVLLLALGPRALPPRDVERIERRSPLEHVDALSRAYQQVGATRTATARLLRGVRRRVEPPGRIAGPGESDDAFLEWAQRRKPALASEIAAIRRALVTPLPARELEAVGSALHALESSLTTRTR